MPMIRTLSIALLLATVAATAQAQGHGDHTMLLPTDLKWADVP